MVRAKAEASISPVRETDKVIFKLLGGRMGLSHELRILLHLIRTVACLKSQKNRNMVIPSNCV